ncbi:MAG: ATP-binding protein [Bacteroidaceae bacterium]|nr:ATP-binding protein [Bacteroidaceae bacterium]
MIIRIRIKNFLSFHDEIEFSMQPGQGRLKPEHKSAPIGGYSTLKTAAIYGANAGGKSNLVKAIAFIKYMVLHGTHPESLIDYHKFLLSKDAKENNSKIEIEFQTNNKNYDYGIEFNNEEIVSEWLYEFTKRSDNCIFSRENNKFALDGLFKRNKSEETKQYLQFFAQSTPKNQLFLHEVFTRNMEDNVNDISDLLAVTDWFLNKLKIIFPDTPYKNGVMLQAANDIELQRFYAVLLRYFDTGIDSIKLNEIDIEKLGIPQTLLRDIKSDLLKTKGKDAYGALSFDEELYLISAEKGQIKTRKLITIHKMIEGSKNDVAMFSLSNESDGTKRLFDYIPLILDLMRGSKVFVVDEIERSLHPSLVYQIFQLFLESCGSVESQLIVTSHETTLMTQNLLRKDEIWFMEKNNQGESNLISLEEYKVRFDKELRGSYLEGAFGGVPKFNDEEFRSLLNKTINTDASVCQENEKN